MNRYLKPAAISLVSLTLGLGMGVFFTSSAQNQKVFELRTYTATPGNLEKLHARFRNHTTRIFNKHGMEVVGYWSPTSEEESTDTIVYMLEHASRDAADVSWSAFINDTQWSEVAAASNVDGQILDSIESKYLVATDYSPMK
ncbi:MAG: hypothetical protein ACJA2Q_000716 [Pseudohongiellaceae bacterium]|jgi:hypothetical protein